MERRTRARKMVRSAIKMNAKQFYAIQVISKRNQDIPMYLCVPQSWLFYCIRPQKVLFFYPIHDYTLAIKNRGKKEDKPKHCWPILKGFIVYQSENYQEVESWISTRHDACEKENSDEDNRGRKLSSSSNHSISGFEKETSLTVKSNKNRRRLLTRRSSKLPLQSEFEEKTVTNDSKSDETDNTDNTVINYLSLVRKQTPLTSNKSKQLIQSAQKVVTIPLDSQTSSEHTPPTLSTDNVQHASYADNVQHEDHMEERLSTDKTSPLNSPEKSSQCEQENERLAPADYHQNSPSGISLQNIPTGQSKEAVVSSNVRILQILNMPTTVPTSSSTPGKSSHGKRISDIIQYRILQTNAGSLTEPTSSHQKSPGPIDNTPPSPHFATNLKQLTMAKCLKNIRPSTEQLQIDKQAPQIDRSSLDGALRQANNNTEGGVEAIGISQNVPPQGIQTSSAQNPSNLTPHFFVEQSQHQQHLPMQEHNFPNIPTYSDQNSYILPVTMQSDFILQSNPNSISQLNQQRAQYNQYVSLNSNHMQELLKYREVRSKLITQNVGSNIQITTQNSSNQLHHNFQCVQQKQDCYQDLSAQSDMSKENTKITGSQEVIRKTQYIALPATLNQPNFNAKQGPLLPLLPRVQARLNQNPVEHQISDTNVPGNIPNTQDSEAQTALLPDRLHENPPTLLSGLGVVYQNTSTNKMVVDQVTEMDLSLIDNDYSDDEADKLPNQSTSQVKQGSQLASAVMASKNRPIPLKNLQTQLLYEQQKEMLDMCGTLFAEIGANYNSTCQVQDQLRNYILQCANTYKSLLEKIGKYNQTEFQISRTMFNDQSSSERKIPQSGNKKRKKFVLPPEYDSNDSRWTLKYKRNDKGLIELIPRTKIYVSKKGLKKCKRKSKDCRTFAKMLLTEVFSRNALAVCSFTGGKDNACKSENLDVRPGLDENAKKVLFAFVQKYGDKRGWKTNNTTAIIYSILSEILEVRAKFSRTDKSSWSNDIGANEKKACNISIEDPLTISKEAEEQANREINNKDLEDHLEKLGNASMQASEGASKFNKSVNQMLETLKHIATAVRATKIDEDNEAEKTKNVNSEDLNSSREKSQTNDDENNNDDNTSSSSSLSSDDENYEYAESDVNDNKYVESSSESSLSSLSSDEDYEEKSSKNIKKGIKKKVKPKKAFLNIRPFVLPPEYDPKDSRWTLKYPDSPKLGLVELMPKSKVYIDKTRLLHCKRGAQNSKMLARMLLEEIFSRTALSVCTLTGTRPRIDMDNTKVRPGLDEHARMVILNYVEKHAREKNWDDFDSRSVITSIRSRIQTIRDRYGQTE